MSAVVEEVARKLGGHSVLGRSVRSQADLALAVRRRLPLIALKGLAQAGLTEQEIERFVIPQRTRRHRARRSDQRADSNNAPRGLVSRLCTWTISAIPNSGVARLMTGIETKTAIRRPPI